MNRKTIIITGSTRGLDLAFVKKFLDLGNNAIINGRNHQYLSKQ